MKNSLRLFLILTVFLLALILIIFFNKNLKGQTDNYSADTREDKVVLTDNTCSEPVGTNVFTNNSKDEIEKNVPNSEYTITLPSNAPDSYKYIVEGAIAPGDSFIDSYTNLKCTIDYLELSGNVYDAGWKIEQFPEANVYFDEYNGIPFSVAVDKQTGALPENIYILTVGLTVYNTNDGDMDEGKGDNIFANTLLYLAMADPRYTSGVSLPYKANDVFWQEGSTDSQSLLVKIEPGETVHYKLGYIMDYGFTIDNTFLASMPSLAPGVVFLPAAIAEWK